MKRKPVAKLIAEAIGGEWKAIRDGMSWRYKCTDGRVVRAYSQLSPQYDGDDETCHTIYCLDTGEQVHIGLGLFLNRRNPK